MRWLLLLCSLLLCSSCGGVSKTKTLTNDAQLGLDALKASLPNECKTEAVNASLRSLQAQITSIGDKCVVELSVEKQKVTNRNLLITIMLIIMAFMVKKKLF